MRRLRGRNYFLLYPRPARLHFGMSEKHGEKECEGRSPKDGLDREARSRLKSMRGLPSGREGYPE
jgi:hypothetical protein